MNRISGRRVLVTGASSGIGEACARRFAESGADLYLVARREERLAKLKETLERDHGVDVRVSGLDVRVRGAFDCDNALSSTPASSAAGAADPIKGRLPPEA